MSDSQVTQLLEQGIAAAKAGRNEEARQALLQAVGLDERNEQAWLWLSGVAESLDERRVCLENVLSVNPNNAHAQAGLRWLAQHAPAPPPKPPTEAPVEIPVEVPPEPPPEPPPEEDRCPHCGASVPPSGTECPHCGQPLIVACPACGEYTDVDQTLCPHCGQLLGDFREGASYHLALARAYLDGRKLDRAVEAIARAEAESPRDAQVQATAAGLYEKANRTDLAIAAYQRAIDQTPDNAALYARLGAIYRQRSQPAEARSMYEKAAKLARDDPEILCELARIQIEQDGVTEKALTLLQRAVQRDPGNARAHLLLGDAYASQQNQQQAFKHYDRACQVTMSDTELGLEARRKLLSLQRTLQKQAEIMQPETTTVSRPRGRPGCVTVYAVLLFLGGLAGIVAALLAGLGAVLWSGLLGDTVELPAQIDLLSDLASGSLILGVGAAAALGFAVLTVVIAVGLWNMRNWARIVVIVLQVLGVLGSLGQGVLTISAIRGISTAYGTLGFPTPLLIGMLVGLAIEVYITFWFLVNRKLFD